MPANPERRLDEGDLDPIMLRFEREQRRLASVVDVFEALACEVPQALTDLALQQLALHPNAPPAEPHALQQLANTGQVEAAISLVRSLQPDELARALAALPDWWLNGHGRCGRIVVRLFESIPGTSRYHALLVRPRFIRSLVEGGHGEAVVRLIEGLPASEQVRVFGCGRDNLQVLLEHGHAVSIARLIRALNPEQQAQVLGMTGVVAGLASGGAAPQAVALLRHLSASQLEQALHGGRLGDLAENGHASAALGFLETLEAHGCMEHLAFTCALAKALDDDEAARLLLLIEKREPGPRIYDLLGAWDGLVGRCALAPRIALLLETITVEPRFLKYATYLLHDRVYNPPLALRLQGLEPTFRAFVLARARPAASDAAAEALRLVQALEAADQTVVLARQGNVAILLEHDHAAALTELVETLSLAQRAAVLSNAGIDV